MGNHTISHRPPPLRGLYAITDAQLTPGEKLLTAVDSALEGGATWIQYRDKGTDHHRRFNEASKLRSLCDAHGAGLIVNDDIELAQACRADGVHLGQQDSSLAEARAILGPHAIIGYSCYNRLDLAKGAAASGADYLAFGSLFPSPTKPTAASAPLELLRSARALGLPVCAIGGINQHNVTDVLACGADLIAVISSIFSAADIKEASRQFVTLIGSTQATNS